MPTERYGIELDDQVWEKFVGKYFERQNYAKKYLYTTIDLSLGNKKVGRGQIRRARGLGVFFVQETQITSIVVQHTFTTTSKFRSLPSNCHLRLIGKPRLEPFKPFEAIGPTENFLAVSSLYHIKIFRERFP